VELPEQLDNAEDALASGNRERIGKVLERFFPKGAVLVALEPGPQGEELSIAGGVPSGPWQAIGMLILAAQHLGQQQGCSVMFMQGLNLQKENPGTGLVTAQQVPKGLPVGPRRFGRHG